MNKIDLSKLSYEQLCKLQAEIVKRKEDFFRLGDLYIYDDDKGEPHLCYCSYEDQRHNPSFANSDTEFSDLFTSELICKKRETLGYLYHKTLATYLVFNANNIEYDNSKHYTREELAILWEPIKLGLMNKRAAHQQSFQKKLGTKK